MKYLNPIMAIIIIGCLITAFIVKEDLLKIVFGGITFILGVIMISLNQRAKFNKMYSEYEENFKD